MNNGRNDYYNTEFRKYDIVIIGAGPAGLIGATESHTEGKRSLIIEQMKRPALKLRITGSGSCNITNNRDPEAFMDGFGRNGRFLLKSSEPFCQKKSRPRLSPRSSLRSKVIENNRNDRSVCFHRPRMGLCCLSCPCWIRRKISLLDIPEKHWNRCRSC